MPRLTIVGQRYRVFRDSLTLVDKDSSRVETVPHTQFGIIPHRRGRSKSVTDLVFLHRLPSFSSVALCDLSATIIIVLLNAIIIDFDESFFLDLTLLW
jgi:hypothetical protein